MLVCLTRRTLAARFRPGDQMTHVSLINLGCAKNQVDSEEILGVAGSLGASVRFEESPAEVVADVLVVNTCAFIEAAREQSLDTILAAVERKREGAVGRIVVAGCLAQRYGAELAEAMPEVDAFIGTGDNAATARAAAGELIRPGQLVMIGDRPHHRWLDTPTRARTGQPWSAWLKISEGCDHKCTFCAIPSFRGGHVSKPFERVVAEAEALAAQGVLELNLIAQDSTQYGYDLYGRPRLSELLRTLGELDGVRWIRLFYAYPSRVNRALIDAIAETPKVCHYIDMPLQHADDAMLRAMRRPMNRAAYLGLLNDFRAAMPDAALRTTFIVGFPGETEAQFANLISFVEEAQFDRVGVFEYSEEEGTPAAALRPRVSNRVKTARRQTLMETQQAISLERNRRWVGRSIEVLVEERAPSGELVGRTFRDGPEVDGTVLLRDAAAQPGEFLQARIVGAHPYDLIAEPLVPARAA